MIKTTRYSSLTSAVALGLGLIALFSSATQAASISYGSFGPVAPGISFIDVTESSATDPVPLFGPPTAYSVGLDFNPTSFGSSSANGTADITDGQLNFMLQGQGLNGFGFLSISEAGDYTLVGPGVPTAAYAGVIVRATVLAVNGVNVVPVNLVPSNASVGFTVPPPAQIAQPWSLGIGIDIGAQVAALFGPGAVASKVNIAIDNTLATVSAPGTSSFIAKKRFSIEIVPLTFFPEPASGTMAFMAFAGIGLSSRRKRS